jgi:hypothetical protein
MLFPILGVKPRVGMLLYTKVVIHVGMPTTRWSHNSKLTSTENKHGNPLETVFWPQKKLVAFYIGKCAAGRVEDDCDCVFETMLKQVGA